VGPCRNDGPAPRNRRWGGQVTTVRHLKARPGVSWEAQARELELAGRVAQLASAHRARDLGNTQNTPNALKTPGTMGRGTFTPHRSVDPVAWRKAVWLERSTDIETDHAAIAQHNRRSALHAIVAARETPPATIKEGAYRLRDLARVAHPSKRCADCGDLLHGMPALMKRPDGGHTVSGVVTCANVWACPVCALKIKAARAEQIKEGVALQRKYVGGKSMLMLTLTARHTVHTDLREYREGFQAAAGRLFPSHWQREVGMLGYVYGAEATHGRNGFHYHRHVILSFDGDVGPQKIEALRAHLADRWERLVVRFMGEDCRPNEHGLHIKPLDLAEYISKLGLELADVGAKVAQSGHRSPWGILHDAATGHGRAFEVMAEYVRAMKGAKCIQFSNRLLAFWTKLGMGEVDETAAADDAIGAALVSEVPLDAWRAIRARGALWRVLNAADLGELPTWAEVVDGRWGDGYQVEREAIRDGGDYPRHVREPAAVRRARLMVERAAWNTACDELARFERAPFVPRTDSPFFWYEEIREKLFAVGIRGR
jgi:hypothetical protein